jgi:anti-sigma B factor antagonist
MEMITRDVDGVTIVDLEGDLDTNTAPQAEAYLKKLAESEGLKVVLNLKKLEYTSSAGLRVFLTTAKQLSAVGGTMRVCCLNETVDEIFDISGFATILNVAKTEEEALAAF